MGSEKTCFSWRVYEIAAQYGVSWKMTHSIVSTYIQYCRECLLNGEPMDFLGLVYIEPDVVTSKYRSTLAYKCSEVASMLSLPEYSVYVIIREYLDSMQEDVLAGKPIEIRGIVSVTPLYQDGVLSIIHSSISAVIRERILAGSYPVSSVRVHTRKDLKSLLARRNEG